MYIYIQREKERERERERETKTDRQTETERRRALERERERDYNKHDRLLERGEGERERERQTKGGSAFWRGRAPEPLEHPPPPPPSPLLSPPSLLFHRMAISLGTLFNFCNSFNFFNFLNFPEVPCGRTELESTGGEKIKKIESLAKSPFCGTADQKNRFRWGLHFLVFFLISRASLGPPPVDSSSVRPQGTSGKF